MALLEQQAVGHACCEGTERNFCCGGAMGESLREKVCPHLYQDLTVELVTKVADHYAHYLSDGSDVFACMCEQRIFHQEARRAK